MLLIIFISFLCIGGLILLFYSFLYNKKRLSPASFVYFKKILKHISELTSSKEQILEYDKLYHKILLELKYKWSFWEILKQHPSIISDINKIWELHKLRNKLAHEFDNISNEILTQKSHEYKQHILTLLNKIK